MSNEPRLDHVCKFLWSHYFVGHKLSALKLHIIRSQSWYGVFYPWPSCLQPREHIGSGDGLRVAVAPPAQHATQRPALGIMTQQGRANLELWDENIKLLNIFLFISHTNLTIGLNASFFLLQFLAKDTIARIAVPDIVAWICFNHRELCA